MCTHIISFVSGNRSEDPLLIIEHMSSHDHVAHYPLDLGVHRAARRGYFGWQRFQGASRTLAETARKSAISARSAAVSVKIAPVEKADFPVYLTGLGTVQGFNTVVVRTRVDGQIDQIAFKEGATG